MVVPLRLNGKIYSLRLHDGNLTGRQLYAEEDEVCAEQDTRDRAGRIERLRKMFAF
jgi:hypothetical protein